MQQFGTIIMMAVIIEGLITYAKTFFAGGKFQWQQLLGICLGVSVALVYNLNIFGLIGFTTAVPFVGAILTGVLISRGSNYIFDLIRTLQGIGSGNVQTNNLVSDPPLVTEQSTSVDSTLQQAAKAVNNNTAPNPPDAPAQS